MSDNEKENVEPGDGNASVEPTIIEDAEIVEEIVDPDLASETEPSPQTPQEDGTAEVAVDPSGMQQPARPGNPIIPLIIGGVVAGAVGFATATYLNFGAGQSSDLLNDLSDKLVSQSAEVTSLNAEIARVEALTDSTALATSIQMAMDSLSSKNSAAIAAVSSQIDDLSTAVSKLEGRILVLEKRPMAEAFSDEAIAAYEAEMTSLREAIAQHRSDIEAIAADARAMESAARQESLRSEGTSWLTAVSIAVSDGSSFVGPLQALADEGVEIPVALSHVAEDGVATLAELLADFPPAARAALSAVRSGESAEPGNGGLLSFLQNQVGARSVSPKEGDDADAVLSRAEANAKSGDLTSSIAEIANLTEVGQAAMSDWVLRAQERIDVEAALAALRETVLNK